MSLQVEITKVKLEVERLENQLKNLKNRLQYLCKAVEVDLKDLIKSYHLEDGNFFKTESKEGKYEYILGGDGRSSPWSETRIGLVLNITLDNRFYISNSTREKFEEYLKNIDDFKNINITTAN